MRVSKNEVTSSEKDIADESASSESADNVQSDARECSRSLNGAGRWGVVNGGCPYKYDEGDRQRLWSHPK